MVGLVVRLWQMDGKIPSWWGDSTDYLKASRASLLSLELWAGPRTVVVPLLLKLVGGDDAGYVHVQTTLAALCWAALAASVVTVVSNAWLARLAAVAITVISLAFPVVMWERSVLSESLAMSSLALVVAALIQLARGVTAWRVVAGLAALTLWVATRDTHVVVVLLGAVGLAVWVILRRPPSERLLALLATGAFLMAVLAGASASHGHRSSLPMRNVYAARVLPYPQRVEWFAAHGMPQSELFVGPGATPIVVEKGRPAVRYVGADDPVLQPWVRWVEREGRRMFLRWMVTHPAYVLREPWREPERAFNNALGDRSFYAPSDRRDVPLVTGASILPMPLALLLAAAAMAAAFRWNRWRSPAFVVGAILVVLSGPHALVSWHSDGMETARHLVVPVVQFHLGVLLLLIGALAGAPGTTATDTSD
ncbi:MAG TPA: hypothetical protein VGJ86_25265 [Acidimicrobiales bacterium]|jgi:hypothetical protein